MLNITAPFTLIVKARCRRGSMLHSEASLLHRSVLLFWSVATRLVSISPCDNLCGDLCLLFHRWLL